MEYVSTILEVAVIILVVRNLQKIAIAYNFSYCAISKFEGHVLDFAILELASHVRRRA